MNAHHNRLTLEVTNEGTVLLVSQGEVRYIQCFTPVLPHPHPHTWMGLGWSVLRCQAGSLEIVMGKQPIGHSKEVTASGNC